MSSQISSSVITVMIPQVSIICNDLSEILNRHLDYQDFLSRSIFDWAQETRENIKDSFENYQQCFSLLENRVYMLATTILVNPLTGAPFEDPVIDGAWEWEMWMHNDCRSCCRNISPLDHKEMEVSPKTHQLAKEILSWVSLYFKFDSVSFIKNGGSDGNKPSLTQEELSSMAEPKRKATYCILAHSARKTRFYKNIDHRMVEIKKEGSDEKGSLDGR